VEIGATQLVGTEVERIVAGIRNPPAGQSRPTVYGTGDSANKIAAILEQANLRQ
jgi:hypothetical protein